MSYYDEPYYEPTPADMIFEEANQKLKEVLKESIKHHVESVTKENEELKIENKKLQNKVSDINRRERNLEEERKNMKRLTLSELMGDREMIMWKADYHREISEPCGKCDTNRKVTFKTPLGKEMKELCSCYASKNVYEPVKSICYEMKKNGRDQSLIMWFKSYSDSDDGYSSSTAIYKVWKDEKYEDIDKYNWRFKTKDDCKKYCDYINTKEELNV